MKIAVSHAGAEFVAAPSCGPKHRRLAFSSRLASEGKELRRCVTAARMKPQNHRYEGSMGMDWDCGQFKGHWDSGEAERDSLSLWQRGTVAFHCEVDLRTARHRRIQRNYRLPSMV